MNQTDVRVARSAAENPAFSRRCEDRAARERHRDPPYGDACVAWCDEYNQAALAGEYPTKPTSLFEPLARRTSAAASG